MREQAQDQAEAGDEGAELPSLRCGVQRDLLSRAYGTTLKTAVIGLLGPTSLK